MLHIHPGEVVTIYIILPTLVIRVYLRPHLLIHHVILQANIVILAIVLKKIYDSGGLRNESKSGRLRYVHYIRKKSLEHRRYILGRHENYQYLRLNYCDISNPIKVIAISHNLEYHNIFSIASYKRSVPFLLKTRDSFFYVASPFPGLPCGTWSCLLLSWVSAGPLVSSHSMSPPSPSSTYLLHLMHFR